MDVLLPVTLALCVGIGFALGVFGGGGSILTVPLLVYGAHIAPATAITMSLAIVGGTSLLAAYPYLKKGHVQPRVALLFGSAGILTAILGARLSHGVSGNVLMLLFAMLMVTVGAFMLFARVCRRPREMALAPGLRTVLSLAAGAVVGGLTGFLGVGGGFLVVPALIAFTGLGLREAVGTSLVVIAINSAAGFVGHLPAAPVDLKMVAALTVFAMLGGAVGAHVAQRMSVDKLRQGFAVSVLIIGIVVAIGSIVPRSSL